MKNNKYLIALDLGIIALSKEKGFEEYAKNLDELKVILKDMIADFMDIRR